MAGYDLELEVKKEFTTQTRHFLDFMKAVARKYPVKLSYKHTSSGHFYVRLDASPGAKIDGLLLELILNRGLYYYFASLRSSHSGRVLREAIIPTFQALVESHFRVPYSGFLRRHILGSVPQDSFIPGDLTETSAHAYEIVFRKWDIGILDDWNFVKDADSLITAFLLKQSGHIPGNKSPAFGILLNQAAQVGIAMDRETRKEFDAIHRARSGGLHRLQTSLSHNELLQIASRIFLYFEYFDEFRSSQLVKTEKLHGKRYKRIRYGNERWPKLEGWAEVTRRPCHDCFAINGQLHCDGCDMEQCPRCLGQHLGCGCQLDSDVDTIAWI
jgi:hypothetical protein